MFFKSADFPVNLMCELCPITPCLENFDFYIPLPKMAKKVGLNIGAQLIWRPYWRRGKLV